MSLAWIRETDYDAMSTAAALRIANAVERRLRSGRPMLLGLATGNTMLELYKRLAGLLNERRVGLAELHTFNLDEYVGADGRWVPVGHPLSYRAYMQRNLFDRIDPQLGLRPEHIHFPDPLRPAEFDALIERLGGLDLQLLGIGFNGHIAFNEPMRESQISPAVFAALPTRVIDLTELTIETNARLTAGGDRTQVPRQAATMGMKPILAAREILLLACFAEQQEPLQEIMRRSEARIAPLTPAPFPQGERGCGRGPTSELPASYLLGHAQSTIIYTGDCIALEQRLT